VRQTVPLQIEVNGQEYSLTIPPDRRLIDLLREDLGLTGTKEGCGAGECGACSVFLNGNLVNSCLVLAVEASGGKVLTIEGVARGEELHPVQESFIRNGAIQCGFCTPGMVLSAIDLLRNNPGPTERQVREGMSGNLCRCTGYGNIVKAVLEASGAKK